MSGNPSFAARPALPRLLLTAFWALCVTTVLLAGYCLFSDLTGFTIFGQGHVPKYNMSAEYNAVHAAESISMFMLAIVTLCIRRFSIRLYRLGFLVCLLPWAALAIPSFAMLSR